MRRFVILFVSVLAFVLVLLCRFFISRHCTVHHSFPPVAVFVLVTIVVAFLPFEFLTQNRVAVDVREASSDAH